MLIDFFLTLKKSGIKTTLKELLDLIKALKIGVIKFKTEDFYYLSRSIMVKDEKYYDRFDRAFSIFFNGMSDLDLKFLENEIPEEWLRKQFEKTLSKEERGKMYKTIPRSSIIGFLIGVLPGAGATIASFLAYGMERNFVNDEEKQKFGKGSVNGIAAPETANNAACSGSFVPLLTLGIPGSGTTAVMLGALLGFGIQPGPRLYQTNPEIFWSVIMSMYIGMVVLLILNLPLIPYIARVLATPRTFLIPLILFFSLTGVYLMSFNNFDIYMMIGIAVVATVLRLYDFPMPPLILAFVLGGLMEENLRRSLLILSLIHI